MDLEKIIDYPKMKSPFVRKDIDGNYLAINEFEEGYNWLYDTGVIAVDKIHGSNLCVIFQDGKLIYIDNRKNRILESPAISTDHNRLNRMAIEGVLSAIDRGWIPKGYTGRVYGELVGPKMNGNLHLLDRYYFVPFDYLKNHCAWNSWVSGKYPKSFESIKDWFELMPSLFTKRIMKVEAPAEGLVFYHPNGYKAKIRKDFFDYKRK